MSNETQRLVKLVGRRSPQTARKRQLIASGSATPLDRKTHHVLSDTSALTFDSDHHIFNQARWSTPVRQVLHDYQRKRADYLLVKASNVELVVWIPLKPLP